MMNNENSVKLENQSLVSVGIPTYNRPEGLKRTLECITGQTYKNLEVIVSDNCSPDPKVEAVVKKFQKQDNRIQYFRQIENFGPSNNFKFVLEKATGEYFMWAADDDEWENMYIESLVKQLENHPNISVAFCQTVYKNNEGSDFFPFFTQGMALNSLSPRTYLQRLDCAVEGNYGELFYGIFRKRCLLDNSIIDFEYSGLIHATTKAMLMGDAYVSSYLYFIKGVTKEVYLWTYLCAKQKNNKSKNLIIDEILDEYRCLLIKRKNVIKIIVSSFRWHYLYFATFSKTIKNLNLPIKYFYYIKIKIFIQLFISSMWTISAQYKFF